MQQVQAPSSPAVAPEDRLMLRSPTPGLPGGPAGIDPPVRALLDALSFPEPLRNLAAALFSGQVCGLAGTRDDAAQILVAIASASVQPQFPIGVMDHAGVKAGVRRLCAALYPDLPAAPPKLAAPSTHDDIYRVQPGTLAAELGRLARVMKHIGCSRAVCNIILRST